MKKTWLLLIIGVAMAFITSCKKKEVSTPPVPHTGDEMTLPYVVSFETNFGTYSTQNILGDQEWVIDFSTAKMAGSEKDETGTYINYDNEDWLVSSPVNISGVSHAKVSMIYIGRYFSDINNDVKVMVSRNYSHGSSVTSAEWVDLHASLAGGANWDEWYTAEVSLDEYIGSTVTIAVKYVSTTAKAGTIEVKSMSIVEGEVDNGGGGEAQSLPYNQSFTTSFGTYTTKNVVGDQVWVIDYSSAKMAGAEKINGDWVYYDNEDWLISSPVAITGVENAKMVMTYIGCYFGNINNDITIWASEDYEFGDMPETATWTQVPSVLVGSNNWDNWNTAELNLDAFVGKTVTLAVKYISTTTKAGTIEIKSISIEEGEAVAPPTPPTPGPEAGSGTADDPYNVSAGISRQGQELVGWVQGYIVGAVKNGTSNVSSNDDVIWDAPFNSVTNVVIADDADCREIGICIIVNLPNNKPLRTDVNLVDHPENHGKLLAVNGKLRTYFGQAGLRDSGGTANDFVLEGGVTPPPTPVPPTPGTIISETFENGQGDFEIVDVNLPEGLTYIWNHNSQYKCMKASAYVEHAFASESWLVSPVIDLTEVSQAMLSFDHAVNYASPVGALSVMISTNYNGNVAEADWTELDVDQWPAGNNWDFVNASAVLNNYVGQTVTIAFKYTSTASSATTWEVKNFAVSE